MKTTLGLPINGLRGASGKRAQVTRSSALVSIDSSHQRIHEGRMYTVSRRFLDVANDGYARLLLHVGEGYSLHMLGHIEAGGDSYVNVYEGSEVTDNGTAIGVYNRNREYGDNPLEVSAFYAPTFTPGDQIYESEIHGGEKTKALGGSSFNDGEWLLPGPQNYIFEAQDKSGGTIDISMQLTFYIVNGA